MCFHAIFLTLGGWKVWEVRHEGAVKEQARWDC